MVSKTTGRVTPLCLESSIAWPALVLWVFPDTAFLHMRTSNTENWLINCTSLQPSVTRSAQICPLHSSGSNPGAVAADDISQRTPIQLAEVCRKQFKLFNDSGL